ncbi:MAG: hypothetical protein AABX38_00010 [Candidatus Micrarchaeota archaeon]
MIKDCFEDNVEIKETLFSFLSGYGKAIAFFTIDVFVMLNMALITISENKSTKNNNGAISESKLSKIIKVTRLPKLFLGLAGVYYSSKLLLNQNKIYDQLSNYAPEFLFLNISLISSAIVDYICSGSNGMVDRTKAGIKSVIEKTIAAIKPVSEPAFVPVKLNQISLD